MINFFRSYALVVADLKKGLFKNRTGNSIFPRKILDYFPYRDILPSFVLYACSSMCVDVILRGWGMRGLGWFRSGGVGNKFLAQSDGPICNALSRFAREFS